MHTSAPHHAPARRIPSGVTPKSFILAAATLLSATVTTSALGQDDTPFAFATAAAVADSIVSGDATVLDVRSIGAYLAGHAPGALHFDDESVRGPRGGLPVQFRPTHELRRMLKTAGVSFTRPVILMGAADDPLAATMVAHVLLQTGHSDVSVVDGGWDAWAANHPVTRTFPTDRLAASAAPAPATDTLEMNPDADASSTGDTGHSTSQTIGTVTLDDIRDDVGWNEVVFVDARPARHYRGEVPAWPRSGHIPGAINLDWTRLVEADNRHRLRPEADLRRIVFEDIGLNPDAQTIVYCGTGREATLLALTLRHTLGMSDVSLFEGSWVAYAADASMPSEVGPRVAPRVRVRRDGDVSFSAQPDLATLKWLANDGVRTVVNCRSAWEHGNRMPYTDADAAKLGLQIINIPLGGDDGYDPAAVAQLNDVIASTEGPMHIHCSSGGRARTLWTAWLIEHEGLTPDAAFERVAAIGGGPSSLERLVGRRMSVEVTDEPVATPEP
ncbi:MAG: rhodanese-like domain-containing protein [Phycisphaerales bacterium]